MTGSRQQALMCGKDLAHRRRRPVDLPGVWTSLGPDGGFVNALAIDPTTPNTVYAGTGGMVRR